MKKEITGFCLLYILIFFLSGCHDNTRPYYLKDHWKTSSTNLQLKNKPKEVKEYFFKGENNISQSDLKKAGSYDLYTYDLDGNLVTRKLFFNDDMWYEFEYTYSKKGFKTEFITKSIKGITRKKTTDFEVISDSICQETLYDDPLVKDVRIYHYKKGGNQIVREQSVEAKEYKRKSKTYYWYDGQQILKEIFITRDQEITRSIETQYYYDTNNHLDSIIRRTGEGTDRTIFKKNKHGDPVYMIRTSNMDTSAYISYTYLYDNNINWIRRVEKNQLVYGYNSPEKVYSLIIREIKY